jgi:inner membrane protein
MATAFTHALVGSALAVAAPAGTPRARLALALAALAVLPDIDVLGFHLDIPYEHWIGHRGLLHSLAFAACAGVLTAALAFRDPPRGSRRWWVVAGLLALATASHGLLDAFTDGGLGVGFWLPFHDARSFLPWRPLPASPLSLGAFMGAQGCAILAAEARWLWPPVLVLAGALALLRRHSLRHARTSADSATSRR